MMKKWYNSEKCWSTWSYIYTTNRQLFMLLRLCPRNARNLHGLSNFYIHSILVIIIIMLVLNRSNWCFQQFTVVGRAAHLNIHTLTNSKERPYVCVLCNIWSSCTSENAHAHCSPTVEWKLTLAQNVRRHLVKQDHWGCTWSPTLGRKYTNVQNVEVRLVELETWKVTCTHPQ